MINLFNNFIYEPLLAVLVFIYQNIAFGDLGLSIILLTIFVRVVLFPVFWKSAKDQALMNRLQPHIKQIQLDHKDDREEQAKKLMALYKEHRLNPLSGFLLLLIQLPILIAIYHIILRDLTTDIFTNFYFLGLLDLGEKSLVLAVIAAAFQYLQGKISFPRRNSSKKDDLSASMAQMGRMMIIIGPAVTFFILVNLPAAVGIYWTTSVLFSLGQQVIINKKLPKIEHDGEYSGKNKKHAGADGLQKNSG